MLSLLSAEYRNTLQHLKRFDFQGHLIQEISLNTKSQNVRFCVLTTAEGNFTFHAKGSLLLLFFQILLFL